MAELSQHVEIMVKETVVHMCGRTQRPSPGSGEAPRVVAARVIGRSKSSARLSTLGAENQESNKFMNFLHPGSALLPREAQFVSEIPGRGMTHDVCIRNGLMCVQPWIVDVACIACGSIGVFDDCVSACLKLLWTHHEAAGKDDSNL